MYMTPPPVTPRLLRRSSGDRIFGGVCGGLGRYWNVDPVILRVAFGVSLLLGGFGLFAYLAMWWLVPDEGAPSSARVAPGWGLRVLGVGAATIAGFIGLALLFGDSSFGGGGVVLGALIAGIVVWIVVSQRSPQRPVEAVPPTGYAYGGTGDYGTTALEQPSLPPLPPRERSYLGLMGLCGAIAATGMAMLLTDSVTTVFAAGLLALGVTLVIGAFRGRARWLLLFAVPLLLMVSIAAQVQRIDRPVGDVTWQPTAGENSYSLGFGTASLDFASWQTAPGPGDRINADIGAGQLTVDVPRNWDLVLNTDFGAASVTIDGKESQAVPVNGSGRITIPAKTATADGTLRLDVSVRVGEVVVTTGSPAIGSTRPLTIEPTKRPALKKEKAA